jgi:hypothetical protein
MEGLSAVLLGSTEKEDEIQRWINLINHHFRSRMPIPTPGIVPSNQAVTGKPLRRDRELTQKTIVEGAEALFDLMFKAFELKQDALSLETAGSHSATGSMDSAIATSERELREMMQRFPTPMSQNTSKRQKSENGDNSPTLGPFSTV